jgi:hypothetical protein
VYFGDSSEWSDTGFRDIIEVFRDRIGSGMCYFENGKSRWPTPSQVAPVVDLPPPLGRRRVYLHMISALEPFARERSQGVAAYFGNVSARTLATLTLAACLPERLKLLAVPWLVLRSVATISPDQRPASKWCELTIWPRLGS